MVRGYAIGDKGNTEILRSVSVRVEGAGSAFGRDRSEARGSRHTAMALPFSQLATKSQALPSFGMPVVTYNGVVTLEYTQYGGEGYLRGGDEGVGL